MDTDSMQGTILIVGDAASIGRAGLDPDDIARVEVVSSLPEAIDRHHAGGCERVIVDPSALDGSTFQILARAPVMAEAPGRKRRRASDKVRAEAIRHAAELEALFSSITDAAIFVDTEGEVLLANSAARAYFEAPDGEDFSKCVEKCRFETMSGRPMSRREEATSRALAGETLRDVRYRLISPSGLERAISVSASAVSDSRGRVVGAATIFRDISERFEIERRRDELYQREHRIAQILQQALIPPKVPERIGDYAFAVQYKSALEEASVGGDFYDIYSLAHGRIAVLIGDVAGKGLEAAIRVAAARYSIRSYVYLDPRPGRVMTLANRALCRDRLEQSGMLTAFFAVIDSRIGAVSYSNAGHERPLLITADGDWRSIRLPGLPLGISESIEYPEDSLRLNPGDRIVLVTDGITEARCRGSRMFGVEGLLECVSRKLESSIQELAAAIMDSAREYADGRLQDDSAVVVVEQCSGELQKTSK